MRHTSRSWPRSREIDPGDRFLFVDIHTAAGQLQHEAAASAVACWFMQDTDYVASWAPFSNVPTQYLVTIDGIQKWYGQ